MPKYPAYQMVRLNRKEKAGVGGTKPRRDC